MCRAMYSRTKIVKHQLKCDLHLETIETSRMIVSTLRRYVLFLVFVMAGKRLWSVEQVECLIEIENQTFLGLESCNHLIFEVHVFILEGISCACLKIC